MSLPNANILQRGLVGALGDSDADRLMAEVAREYSALFAERERYDDRALQEHLEKNILPGLALYRVLCRDEVTSARALAVTERVFDLWGKSGRRRMAFLGRFPFFYHLIRLLVRPMMRNNFPSAGWDLEWIEVSSQVVAFDMHSCFYLDTFRAYGAEELTSIYCRLDDAIYDGVSPYVRWERTKTLGRGNECCDFRFRRGG
jgi:hypothetical protein